MNFSLLRLLLDPMAGEFNGGGSPAVEPDIAPENGGPDRSFSDLSNATVEDSSVATGPTSAALTQPLVPADPNNAAPAQPAAEQWQSIRDAAAAYGYQVPQGIADDRAMLMHLLQQAGASRQSDAYAQLGRQLAPKATEIQQYLAQQTKQQSAPTRQPWEAPEFDPRWAGLVEQDPATGLFYSKPGTPHEIAQKTNAYVEWKANFDKDPAAVMNKMVEARARDIARETFQEQFAAQSRQAEISQIVQTNSEWLYQKGQDGRPVVGYDGRYVPTPVGARYMHHVGEAQRMGVTNPRDLDALAKNLVRGEFAAQQYQAHQQAANPQTAAAVAQPNLNPLQNVSVQQQQLNPAATEPSAQGMSLNDMIRQAMKENGVTDNDFANIGG